MVDCLPLASVASMVTLYVPAAVNGGGETVKLPSAATVTGIASPARDAVIVVPVLAMPKMVGDAFAVATSVAGELTARDGCPGA